MTERTIVADEVTCPKCLTVDTDTHEDMTSVYSHERVMCDCGCVFDAVIVAKMQSTEVPSE